MKTLKLFTLVAGFALFAVPVAQAQSRASVGGVSTQSMQQALCLDSVRRLETTVTELENFATDLQACNDSGQIYNGIACVDVAKLDHEWFPNEANPTQIIIRDNGVEVARVAVIRGNNGADATCPAGTVPAGGGGATPPPVVPPVSPPPVSPPPVSPPPPPPPPPPAEPPQCGPATSCAAGYGLVGSGTNACSVGSFSAPGGDWCGTGCCWRCSNGGDTIRCSKRTNTCFAAGTLVTLADGTAKAIETIVKGDVVLGQNEARNTVQEVLVHKVKDKKLYAFNGGAFFVTAEHPFMTADGWKAISPDMTSEYNPQFVEENGKPGVLQVGDVLHMLDGERQKIESIESRDRYPHDMPVYNLRVDGNHTYFASEYLVHNK